MPSVLPRTSYECAALLTQPPRCRIAFFSGMPRISMMISASTSSATLRVLENGALKTGMPRPRAACRSIWLVPMQKAPIADELGCACCRTSAVSWVRERMPTKWASPDGLDQLIAGQRLGGCIDLV